MKRLHVHVSVASLEESIGFYSALFGAEPDRLEADYAKWMLDDPRVNFAVSTRGLARGINHLGIQAESAEELEEMHRRLRPLRATPERDANCCYANSDKYWLTDPQGVVWEAFHTLDTVPVWSKRPSAQVAGTSLPFAGLRRLFGRLNGCGTACGVGK